jgi:hypothetical protein
LKLGLIDRQRHRTSWPSQRSNPSDVEKWRWISDNGKD